MRARMNARRGPALGLLLACVGASFMPSAFADQPSEDHRLPPGREWLHVGGDLGNTRHSTLTQINRQTVKGLGGAWMSKRFDDGASSRATPVVKDGLMFMTAGARVYALNARNGETIWTYQTETRQRPSDGSNLIRAGLGTPDKEGVALGEGLVFVGLGDARVIALRQETGELVWDQYVGDDPPHKGQAISGAPIYTRGLVVVGMAADFGMRGRIAALNASTGREVWHFFTVPGPGEPGHETWPENSEVWRLGGGAIWLVGAVDPDLGLVYFATGNPAPQFGGEARPGDNLFTASVIALDVATGKLRWHNQLVHHDIWEADISVSPMMFDTELGGRTRKALAAMRADGYLFLLDRETGKPLLPVEERPVRQEARAYTAKTQPFPVGADRMLPDCTEWRAKLPRWLSGFELGCFFSPVYLDPPNLLAPSFFGVRTIPMAYGPSTGYVYATGTATLEWLRRTDDPYFVPLNNARRVPGLESYGVMAAIDSRTGRIVWKKDFPAGRARGVTTTAGGLLFALAADGYLQAYDVKTGELLWQFETGFLAAGGPVASYEIDGVQYLALSAGPAVWAFSLGGTIPPVPAYRPLPNDDIFSGPIEDTADVETASLWRELGATGTRYTMDEHAFDPFRARVRVGARVTWVNNGKLVHRVTAHDGSWTTGRLEPAQTGSVIFSKPGRHTYICTDHPWAYGQLIVTDEQAQNGVYTNEQAARGGAAYAQHCGSCHADDLGGREPTPALTGSAFLARWGGRSLGDLFSTMRATMPPEASGSLSEQTYLDLAAFVLRANQLPTGEEELRAGSEALGRTVSDR